MARIEDMYLKANLDPFIRQRKWDMRFLQMALLVSKWSKDPSTQVGAVIVDDLNCIVGVGYNGFPRGINDDPKLYADREMKYERVIHGEINAIMNANKSVRGCTLYEVPFLSCARCTVQLIQAGIKRIVYPVHGEGSYFHEKLKRWDSSINLSIQMCVEANIELTFIPWENI